MTVYIDTLFLINFIINFVLLKVACSFLKLYTTNIKLISASFLGGIYSVICFIIQIPFFINIIFLFLVPFIMVFISIYKKPFVTYLKTFLSFLIIAALFNGIIYSLSISTNIGNYIFLENNVFYIHIPFSFLILCCIVFLIISFLTDFVIRKKSKSKIIKLEIIINNKKKIINTFFDSGNNLYEPLSKKPVILAEYIKLRPILPDYIDEKILHNQSLDNLLIKISDYKNLYIIKTNTVNNVSYFLGIKPDEVFIYDKGKKYKTDCIIAIVNKKFCDNDEYNGIIHPDLIL